MSDELERALVPILKLSKTAARNAHTWTWDHDTQLERVVALTHDLFAHERKRGYDTKIVDLEREIARLEAERDDLHTLAKLHDRNCEKALAERDERWTDEEVREIAVNTVRLACLKGIPHGIEWQDRFVEYANAIIAEYKGRKDSG